MSAWKHHPARAELLALYKEVDELLAPFSCPASGECCHFARTGREPYPHAVELEELTHAAKATSALAKKRRLSVVEEDRTCALLGDDGRCRVYASRPFGCRTFFCERVEGPHKEPRDELQAIGRRIADLSARAFPRDPGPRPLSRVLPVLAKALAR
jgi:Fe-S-cluster containining protein